MQKLIHKMSYRRISYLFFFLLQINFVAGQDTLHLSLPDIFLRIETSYPEVLAYASKIKSIQAQSDGARSWMPPTFSVGADRFPYDYMMLNSKDDPMNQAAVMFSLEQMIPNGRKQSAKKNYLNSLNQAQENNAEWTKNVLRAEAKTLYYQRYVAERKLKSLHENLDLLNLFISIAEDRYKYNQADISIIYKAKAKTSDLKNMILMLQSQIAESNIGLNTLMNRDPNTSFIIDTTIQLNDYADMQLNDTSKLRRSDILSMENQINSMKLNQKYMSSLKYPDFGIKFQHMEMFGMPNQYSVMGMISLPIVPWSSKMYTSEVKSMGFEISSMQLQTETMQLMAKRMANERLSMLHFEKSQLQNYEKEIIPSYQKNLETSLLAYKQNTGSFFVLLDAWEMTLMKEVEYLDKLNEALKLEVEYEFVTEKK